MSFKVPSLPKLWKRGNPHEQFIKQCKGLPVSDFESLEILGTIASGSFGIVKLCQKNEEQFVLKELMDEDADQKRLFIKEANLLHLLHHENIVKFHSVLLCGNRKYAFLMEYVHFDFSYFGNECKVSTLKDLLHSLDGCCNFSGFEHLGLCVAKDICSGLAYLHQNDVAHRDLKPDNVLVSNQHYSKDTINLFWKTKPIIAKLTDFGESRPKLIQTSTLLHSKTININRGTPVFMAPEVCRKTSSQMTLDQLKLTDVWSMAMIFFLLINPDKRYPYEEEIKDLKTSGMSPTDIMSSLFTNFKLPVYSKKYNELRASRHWRNIEKAFLFSAKFANRPTANEVQSLLEEKSEEKKDRYMYYKFLCINLLTLSLSVHLYR